MLADEMYFVHWFNDSTNPEKKNEKLFHIQLQTLSMKNMSWAGSEESTLPHITWNKK